jgi:hypothetical protein
VRSRAAGWTKFGTCSVAFGATRAAQHCVVYTTTKGDEAAKHFARLADTQPVTFDEVEQMLIALQRGGLPRAHRGGAPASAVPQRSQAVTFDPFGDFATRGYLRNLAGEQDLAIVRRLEHSSFVTGPEPALRDLGAATTRLEPPSERLY